jgi:hypothetical protein
VKRATTAVGALATVLALVAGCRVHEKEVEPAAPPPPAVTPSIAPAAAESYQGFLYGRITSIAGTTFEGRLRFGTDEEAFWGDYFNGSKDENPWVDRVPPGRLPTERRPMEILGIEIGGTEKRFDAARPFMTRFGDIARIEARGRDVRVTLKSGTVFDLDRFGANDLDGGVRVWDATRGIVDLDGGVEGVIATRADRRIRTIELLPAAVLSAPPSRLHGSVQTRQGDFTGFVQWDREKCVGTDELHGWTADGKTSLRFDTVRSIARRSRDSSLVTLSDGREVVLSDTREVGDGTRGIYVDDRRFGRVLISWDAFERVDFSAVGSGPEYGSFPPGRPLTGSVTTQDGRRLAGRLVYDLDESETTETLDAPLEGVDYTIPFGLIAAIVPLDARGGHRARIVLHSARELQLERSGDLGERHGGVLVFTDGPANPEYVRWEEVARIDFDRPPTMYPPLD